MGFVFWFGYLWMLWYFYQLCMGIRVVGVQCVLVLVGQVGIDGDSYGNLVQ